MRKNRPDAPGARLTGTLPENRPALTPNGMHFQHVRVRLVRMACDARASEAAHASLFSSSVSHRHDSLQSKQKAKQLTRPGAGTYTVIPSVRFRLELQQNAVH